MFHVIVNLKWNWNTFILLDCFASQSDWQQREQELLKKIEELEKFKNERLEDGLKLELKVTSEIKENTVSVYKFLVSSLVFRHCPYSEHKTNTFLSVLHVVRQI